MKRVLRILIRTVLLSAVLVAGVPVGLHYYQVGPRWITTNNSYVKLQMIAVSADVDGRVESVVAANNRFVSQGDLLFQVETEPFQIAVASADAELAKIDQRVNSYKANYRLGQLKNREAEEQVRFRKVQYERQEKLNNEGTGSRVQLDEARHQLAMAKARVKVTRQRNTMALTELTGDPDLPTEQHPLYLKAKATRDQAIWALDRTAIHAPAAGYLSNVNLEPGEYVEAGEPVFSLVVAGLPWVEANLKEIQLTNVRVGQRAILEVDAYPDMTWNAVVSSISHATGAEFALLPPQNATGNWVKVVQRIPVRLQVEVNPAAPPLRTGMTVAVRIDTEQERVLYPFLEDVLRSASAMRIGFKNK